jgi:nitrite reductase (cytochrome c-552)
VASHGASFHAPQEVTRLLGDALGYAEQARTDIARVLARHGYTAEVPMPDISTKEKAQKYIGLDMTKLRKQKQDFLDTVVPRWIATAKKNKRFIASPL